MIKARSLFVKIICMMVCAVIGISASGLANASIVKGAESPSGDNVINVFSVEDYINLGDPENDEPGVLDIFEEETGIKVNYLTFATNEGLTTPGSASFIPLNIFILSLQDIILYVITLIFILLLLLK